jgi:hypothetical protein
LLTFDTVAAELAGCYRHDSLDISHGKVEVVSTSSEYDQTPPTLLLFSNTLTLNPSSLKFFRIASPLGPFSAGQLPLVASFLIYSLTSTDHGDTWLLHQVLGTRLDSKPACLNITTEKKY